MTYDEQKEYLAKEGKAMPPMIVEFSKNAFFIELERAALNEKDHCACEDSKNLSLSGIQAGYNDFFKKAVISKNMRYAGVTGVQFL